MSATPIEPTGTLSQNDIDRLVGDAGGAVGAAADTTAPVSLYDFRRPHRVSKERLRGLEAMYERLVKGLETWLMGRIRGQIEMKLQGVEQFTFGEFTLSLPTPCASFVCEVLDTGGQRAVIDIGDEFTFYLIDKLFGGNGQPFTPGRALSRVERMAMRQVVEKVTALLSQVWAEHIALQFEVTGFEATSDILLQNANREDPMLVANIEIKAGDATSTMLICLPFAVLDKFFAHAGPQRVGKATGTEQERAMSRMLAEYSLRATRVPVAIRLPEFRMRMRDIAALQPGGVIATAVDRSAPVRVLVGDQDRFIGTAGRVAGKVAVRLDGTASEVSSAPAHIASRFTPSVVAEDASTPNTTLA